MVIVSALQASLVYLLRERFYRQVINTALDYLKFYPNDPVLLFFKAFATLNEGNRDQDEWWCYASGVICLLCWWLSCCVFKDTFRRLWESWTVCKTSLRSPCAQWWPCCGHTDKERALVSRHRSQLSQKAHSKVTSCAWAWLMNVSCSFIPFSWVIPWSTFTDRPTLSPLLCKKNKKQNPPPATLTLLFLLKVIHYIFHSIHYIFFTRYHNYFSHLIDIFVSIFFLYL